MNRSIFLYLPFLLWTFYSCDTPGKSAKKAQDYHAAIVDSFNTGLPRTKFNYAIDPVIRPEGIYIYDDRTHQLLLYANGSIDSIPLPPAYPMLGLYIDDSFIYAREGASTIYQISKSNHKSIRKMQVAEEDVFPLMIFDGEGMQEDSRFYFGAIENVAVADKIFDQTDSSRDNNVVQTPFGMGFYDMEVQKGGFIGQLPVYLMNLNAKGHLVHFQTTFDPESKTVYINLPYSDSIIVSTYPFTEFKSIFLGWPGFKQPEDHSRESIFNFAAGEEYRLRNDLYTYLRFNPYERKLYRVLSVRADKDIPNSSRKDVVLLVADDKGNVEKQVKMSGQSHLMSQLSFGSKGVYICRNSDSLIYDIFKF